MGYQVKKVNFFTCQVNFFIQTQMLLLLELLLELLQQQQHLCLNKILFWPCTKNFALVLPFFIFESTMTNVTLPYSAVSPYVVVDSTKKISFLT